MYNAKKHVQKEWQVIGCRLVTFAALGGGYFIPVKSGEIPVARLAAFALSGASLATGVLVSKSKVPFDRQKAAIEAANSKVFANNLAMDAALALEVKNAKTKEAVSKVIGGSNG